MGYSQLIEGLLESRRWLLGSKQACYSLASPCACIGRSVTYLCACIDRLVTYLSPGQTDSGIPPL
jgi:hypothetical protein